MRDRTKIIRHSFAKIPGVVDMPYLLDLQISSFNNFLQLDVPPAKRRDHGLQAVFKSIFPITDVHGTMSLEFVDYSVGVPKYSKQECLDRDMTYAAPLKSTLQLTTYEKQGGEQVVKDIIKQQVFLGEIPLMTAAGTFIVKIGRASGRERV